MEKRIAGLVFLVFVIFSFSLVPISSAKLEHGVTIKLSPNPIVENQKYVISGIGFPHNVVVTLTWGAYATYNGGTKTVNVMANSTGGFSATLVAPDPRFIRGKSEGTFSLYVLVQPENMGYGNIGITIER